MHLTITYILRDGEYQESASLVKNLRTTDYKQCDVILDLDSHEILKLRKYIRGNEVIESSTYEDLAKILLESYPGLAKWLKS